MKRTLGLVLLFAFVAFGQGNNLGSNSSPTVNRLGQPLPGVNISVCQPLATSSGTVTSGLAAITMSSNPVTAGFAAGMTIMVKGYSGVNDSALNAGTLTNGQIAGGWTILSVSSTQIIFSTGTSSSYSTTTNGTILQEGSTTTSCAGLATIYSDPTMDSPVTQPLQSDTLGNWNAFATAGLYYVQFYSGNLQPTLKQIGVSITNPFSGTCKNFENIRCVDGYATAGTGSSASPFTGWDSAITWQANTTYVFSGNGTSNPSYYAWSSSLPNLALNGITIRCDPVGGVVLQWNGTGDALLFDGYAAAGNSALGVGNITVDGCIINGNSNATNGIHIKDSHRSHFNNVRVLNVSNAGIMVNGGVANTFDNLKVSNQSLPTGITQSTTPAHCIETTDDGIATQTTASLIYNPICEGLAGQGIYFAHNTLSNGTTSMKVIGGTVENNTGSNGQGIECDAATEVTIDATDIESNSERGIYDNGCGPIIVRNLYGANSSCEFKSNALNSQTKMEGGFCDSIIIDSTFTGMILENTAYNASGTGTFTDSGVQSQYIGGVYSINAGALEQPNKTPLTSRLQQVIADQGTPCTNAELALSAGWGSSPTVTNVAGTGQTCEWTITSGSGSPSSNPTITDTLTNALPSSATVCRGSLIATGTPATTPVDQTTLSATAPVFMVYFTPGTSTAYKFSRTCGP